MQHAVASWDAFLGNLTNLASSSAASGGSKKGESSLMGIAKTLGLRSAASGALTSAGFRFILGERQQQLWSLLLTFLKSKNYDEILSSLKVIFAIGELRLGQSLSYDGAVKYLDNFLKILVELGILYTNSVPFASASSTLPHFVTPAGLALYQKETSAALSRITGNFDSAFQGIVVESNFKIYCYTSNSETNQSANLHVKLLSYFSEILLELPNFIVAQLTADSVLNALKRGIRVANILRYLEAAAHPRCTLPSNVRGQLEVGKQTTDFSNLFKLKKTYL